MVLANPLTVLAWLLFTVAAHAQVLQCSEPGMVSTSDGRMQRAAEGLQRAEPSVSFQGDPTPCQHARQTAKVLALTVGRDPWPSITAFEYFKAVYGDTYFTVERLRMRSPRHLRTLALSLQSRQPRKLATKANTVYRSVVVDGSLVLMISSAVGHEKNAELFDQIRPLLAE